MRRLLWTLGLLALGGGGALLAGRWYLESHGVSARRLAAYVDQRQQGHGAVIGAIGTTLQAGLRATETAALTSPDFAGWPVGAPAAPPPTSGAAKLVANVVELRAALREAIPGDLIVLRPGNYRVEGSPLMASRAGSATAPITVRGGTGVQLLANVAETFIVAAPYWRFDHLQITGICPQMDDCEHAFHVVGNGHHFAAIGNTVQDFNAHFKINGSDGQFPDHGLVEYNTLTNKSVRQTDNPVTPIDLVGASHWMIRANLISDFIKSGGDQVSYGAYAKGGGSGTVFERNVVWCEDRLRDYRGYRVGLSFGGGGSAPRFCRDAKCIIEQSEGVMRDNLVAACSDDGIYLNNAAQSQVVGNWVLGSAGVSVRFAGSSADIEDNLIDGSIRRRDGALLRDSNNDYRGRPSWTLAPPRRAMRQSTP